MPINFFVETSSFQLYHGVELKAWIRRVIRKEKNKCGHITFRFMDDREIQALNIKYLNHDFPTDIITFPYNQDKLINGDIAIGIDMVKRNSNNYDVDFETEMYRVIIHGVLHLLGYDDKSTEEQRLMRQKEDEALSLLTVRNK